jgi:hypothetical protein
MSYIIKKNDPFISIKLTDKGREMLAKGQLTFTSWAIGDSEINYDREDIVTDNIGVAVLSGDSHILKPKDRQPQFKSYISKDGATFLNPLQSANIQTIKAVVNNYSGERGFFTGDTLGAYSALTSDDYVVDSGSFTNDQLSGGTTLYISTTGLTREGNYILLKVTNDTIGTVADTSEPVPYLWYKIQTDNTTDIELDRELPNLNGAGSSDIEYFIYPDGEVNEAFGFGNTSAYWDNGTLSFQNSTTVNCEDVPIWNMNNVWCETLAGTTGLTGNVYEDFTRYGSYRYLGQKTPYFELGCDASETDIANKCEGLSEIDGTNKSIALIHYTNDTVSNFYGEFFHMDFLNNKTLNLHLPTIMYHRYSGTTGSGTTLGMSFQASGSVQTIGTSEIEYYDLYEKSDLVADTPRVVGKVFPQLKMVSIEDEEIVTAMSYKSNRNWTLPPLATNLVSPTVGTGALQQNETMYITYTFENTTGTGLTTTLPCQKYAKITNSTATAKNVEFKIDGVDNLPYMRKIEASYDGRGFHAYNFKVLYQIVDDSETRPDPESWMVYDFTTTGLTTNVGETISPTQLENQNPTTNDFVIDQTVSGSSSTFDITQTMGMAPIASPEILQFGDERFFYGNIDAYIGANIYKTLFGLSIDASQFQFTSNPTRGAVGINSSNLKVSEVGIYDSNNNLVIVGKTSEPIDLDSGQTIMIELSMDF